MGSLLSPIVANLYMETFERETLASTVTAPRLWLRYVDDTFVIWSHRGDKREEFHHHLNQRHPQMKFTREMEKDNRISFLDVLYSYVERKSGTLTTAVYRKPIYSHRPVHALLLTPSPTSEVRNCKLPKKESRNDMR